MEDAKITESLESNNATTTSKIILEEMRKKYVIKKKTIEVPPIIVSSIEVPPIVVSPIEVPPIVVSPIVTLLSTDAKNSIKENLTKITTPEQYIPLTPESLAPSTPIQVLNFQKS